MDVNPWASNLWNIILNYLAIKALTADIPWHNLDKNYIDLWLLLMYIPMQKKSRNWMDPRYISIKWLVPGVEIFFFIYSIVLYLCKSLELYQF